MTIHDYATTIGGFDPLLFIGFCIVFGGIVAAALADWWRHR